MRPSLTSEAGGGIRRCSSMALTICLIPFTIVGVLLFVVAIVYG
jgi:hypothetical protein